MKKIMPFDIVAAPYVNLDGNHSSGLFVVIYNDIRDDEIHYSQNLVGLKITSKPLFMNKYFYMLAKRTHPFLDVDSWVQCSRPHTIDLSKATRLGSLVPGLRMAVYRRHKEFLVESDTQMLDLIPIK